MRKKYKAVVGAITFDLDADRVRIDLSKLFSKYEKIVFRVSDITAIEVHYPSLFKAGMVVFILNGIRYKNSLDRIIDTTHLLFDKETFPRVEKVLRKIVERNGLGDFHEIRSVDAKIVEFTGEILPRE